MMPRSCQATAVVQRFELVTFSSDIRATIVSVQPLVHATFFHHFPFRVQVISGAREPV